MKRIVDVQRETAIGWLPLARLQLGTWPATQAHALTGNRTGKLSVCGTMPIPLSHTNQGCLLVLALILLFMVCTCVLFLGNFLA